MKNLFARLALAAVLGSLLVSIQPVLAQGTTFTYQGRLNTNAVPANGFYEFEFSLYTNAAGTGSKIGSTITNTDVGVTNGLFTTALNFGAVFTGDDTWLATSVRSNGVGSYTALTPLQELTPAPYAIFANTASNLSGTISLAQLPSTVVTNNEAGVTLSDVTVSGDLTLVSPALIDSAGNSLLVAPGNNNFYIGPSAGISNGSGGANVGLGGGSLQSNTNGTNNTGIGYATLGNNTNGSYNTAIGERALAGNTSGNDNTADGRHALVNNTSGSDNTAVGYGALSSNPAGSFNIALGSQAGSTYGANENSNIDIGNPGVGGDNNIIRIGSGQTSTFLAGVINGNGGGLTNLNAAQLIPAVVTNGEPNVTLGSLTLDGTLTLPEPVSINYETSIFPTTYASFLYFGNNNLYVGPSAGNANTGPYNTGFGVGALEANSTGTINNAFGRLALFNNINGSYNNANGEEALYSNTNGSYNEAEGYQALYSNQSGNNNTVDGSQAAYYNTSGSYNVAIGNGALQGNLTGTENVAVGYHALFTGAGSGNVAVGVTALGANGSGVGNTALGSAALYVATGTGNIAIGNGAGDGITTGNDNIFIGNPGVSGDNNVIRIGNGQTETYIDGTILFDGSDTNNGLAYLPEGGLPQGISGEGPFLYGYFGGALGAVGPTTVCLSWDWQGNAWVSNNFSTSTLTVRGGSDLAEPFEFSSQAGEVPQGSVVVIDDENPGRLKVSDQPYDTRVAGVLSGANGIHPGIQMQQQELVTGGKNVALSGRVYVLADAANGAVKPGDLLTTSATPGHAMKVSDHARASGAILGKAMSGLKQGQGMVLVLVTLQ